MFLFCSRNPRLSLFIVPRACCFASLLMHRIKTKYFVRRGNGFVHTALPGVNKFIRPFLFLIVLNETLLLHQAGTSTVAAMEQAESKAMDQIGILKIGDKYFLKAQKT